MRKIETLSVILVLFTVLGLSAIFAQTEQKKVEDGLYFYDIGTMKGNVNLGVHADMPTYGKPGTFWIVKNGVWYPVDETMVQIPKNGGYTYDAQKRKLVAIEQ